MHRPAIGQENSRGEFMMKIKLKRNISTGLAVRTTLKAGGRFCKYNVAKKMMGCK
jgi:hypothetical protein